MYVAVVLLIHMFIGLSWESLKEWKEYLWLAIPGLFMVCGEWWTFDIGIFVTGNVNGEELAAYNITLNLVTSGFVVMVVFWYIKNANVHDFIEGTIWYWNSCCSEGR